MADRITSDNPSVATVDAELARAGGTTRPELRIPAAEADSVPAGDVVRLVLDGSEFRARIAERSDGSLAIRGAYDTPSLARDPEGATNRLREWVDSTDLDFGRTVHVDIVEEGFKYGVRAPGERATYDATGKPDDSLASIARSLDE